MDLPVHSAMLSVHLSFGRTLLRLPSTVPCSITLVRPSDSHVPIPFQFSPLYSCQEIFVRSCMLYGSFPHMLVSDSVFVGGGTNLSEASKL